MPRRMEFDWMISCVVRKRGIDLMCHQHFFETTGYQSETTTMYRYDSIQRYNMATAHNEILLITDAMILLCGIQKPITEVSQ